MGVSFCRFDGHASRVHDLRDMGSEPGSVLLHLKKSWPPTDVRSLLTLVLEVTTDFLRELGHAHFIGGFNANDQFAEFCPNQTFL